MDASELTKWIKEQAAELGFVRCGVAAAGPIPRGDFYRRWLADGYAGTMAYLHRHQGSRVDLRTWLPNARSVVVVALNYHQPWPAPPDDRPRGRVAMYAWGRDYHAVLRERLEELVRRLREHVGRPLDAKICVDTSAIIERELAAAAGIGWIGKNTMVLDAGLGSYFFLGEIITDLPLVPDAPQADHCGSCTRCLDACPTDAFPQPYAMDATRCISYLTIEHRGEIADELADKMGDWVYGCDVCQQVCPYNREAPMTAEADFSTRVENVRPAVDDVVDWDESAYRRFVAGKATERARLGMWQRNAGIAKGNLRRET